MAQEVQELFREDRRIQQMLQFEFSRFTTIHVEDAAASSFFNLAEKLITENLEPTCRCFQEGVAQIENIIAK